MAPNIVFAPNITQNAERRTQTQDARHKHSSFPHFITCNLLLYNEDHCEIKQSRRVTNYHH